MQKNYVLGLKMGLINYIVASNAWGSSVKKCGTKWNGNFVASHYVLHQSRFGG